MHWITENIATILIAALVLFAVFFAARSVWRKKKQGQCIGCDSAAGCENCSLCAGTQQVGESILK